LAAGVVALAASPAGVVPCMLCTAASRAASPSFLQAKKKAIDTIVTKQRMDLIFIKFYFVRDKGRRNHEYVKKN